MRPLPLLCIALMFCAANLSAQTTWDGTIDNNWFNSSNWSSGIPSSANPANIPAIPIGGNFPSINAATTIDFDVNNSGQVTIAAVVILQSATFQNNGSGTIVVSLSGDLDVDASGILSNYAQVDNSGRITVSAGTINHFAGTFNNYNSIINNADFYTSGGATLNNGSALYAGTITNNSNFISGGAINNVSGTILNNLNFTVQAIGSIDNDVEIINNSVFYIGGGTLINDGIFSNYGTLTNDFGATFTNNGTLENTLCSYIHHFTSNAIVLGAVINNGIAYRFGSDITVTSGTGVKLVNPFFDFPAPTAHCFNSITVTLDQVGNTQVTIAAADLDSASVAPYCGVETLSASQTVFSYLDVGSNPVTLTVTDSLGISSSCVTNVIVVFNTCVPSCNQSVPIILSDSTGVCEEIITPNMMLANFIICPDSKEVTVIDSTGGFLPQISWTDASSVTHIASIVDETFEGQTLTVNVKDTTTGNECQGTIVVEDNLTLSITNCNDATLYCIQDTAPVSEGGAVADPYFNDCTGAASLDTSYVDVVTNGNCLTPYAALIQRTWTATNSNGDSSTCVQNITLNKVSLTSFTPICPPDIILDCSNPSTDPENTGYPQIIFGGNQIDVKLVSDNCIELVASASDDCTVPNRIIRTWTIYDLCIPIGPANPWQCGQIIRYVDKNEPVWNTLNNQVVSCPGCPSTFTSIPEIDALGPFPASIGLGTSFTVGCHTFNAPTMTDVSDDNGSVSMEVFDITYEQQSCAGIAEIIWQATDACGNTSTQSQRFTVVNYTGPNWDVEPTNETVNCPSTSFTSIPELDALSPFPASVAFGSSFTVGCQTYNAPAITDVSDGCSSSVSMEVVNVTYSQNTCDKTATIIWQATDECSNSSTRSQVFTIADNAALVWNTNCNDTTLYCIQNSAPVSEGGEVNDPGFDACVGASTLDISYIDVVTNGTCTDPFAALIQRTWTAKNSNNDSSTCIQNITLDKVTLSAFTPICPPDISLDCTNPSTDPENTGYPQLTIGGTALDIDFVSGLYCSSFVASASDDCSVPNQISRSWYIYDLCAPFDVDNPWICTQTITYIDKNEPVWNTLPNGDVVYCSACPSAFTSIPELDALGTFPASVPFGSSFTVGCQTYNAPAMADVSDDSGSVSMEVFDVTYEQQNCAGIAEIIWQATDACGNSSTQKQKFTVLTDKDPDWIVEPTDSVVNCLGCSDTFTSIPELDALGPFPASVPFGTSFTVGCQTFTAPAITDVSDNCGSTLSMEVLVTYYTQNNCDRVAFIDWAVKSECGTLSRRSQVFTMTDNVSPTLVFTSGAAPNDTTVQSVIPPMLTSPAGFTATDNCSTVETVTDVSIGKGTDPTMCDFYNYIINRTYTTTDDCGNTDQYTQVISVQDTIAPVIPPQSSHLIVSTSSGCTALVSLVVSVSDSFQVKLQSTGVVVASGMGFDASGTYDAGLYDFEFTATDPCGNSTTEIYVVEIVDSNGPTAQCNPNVSIAIDSITGMSQVTAAALDNSSSDSCTPDSLLAFSVLRLDATGGDKFFCVDTNLVTTVQLTVTDTNGNSDTCTSQVTVSPSNPTAVCTNISIDLDATGNYTFSAADLTVLESGFANGCASALSFSYSQSSFTCADVGANTIAITATNNVGGISTCNATVTVNDITPPVITYSNTSLVINATAGNCDGPITGLLLNATDVTDCAGSQNLTISNNSPFAISSGADASGNYPIGITTVIFTVTDPSGNAATHPVTIEVKDVETPNMICELDINIVLTSAGTASISVLNIDEGSNDPCGLASMSIAPTNFDCTDLGFQTVTLTGIDNSGNIGTCTTTVEVQTNSTSSVNILCPAAATVTCPTTLDPSITGTALFTIACGTGNLSYTDDISSIPGCGNIVRTWTVTDGNTLQSCTQLITMIDNGPPNRVSSIPNYGIQQCALPALDQLIYNDDCNGNFAVTPVNDTLTIGGFPFDSDPTKCGHYNFNVHRTWTAVDNCGNSASTELRLIRIRDRDAPVLTIPNPLIIATNNACNATVNINLKDYVDDCANDYLNFTIDGIVGNSIIGGVYVIGTHTFNLEVVDPCGNTTGVVPINIQVEDQTTPSAVCAQNLVIALDNTGNAIINPNDVDAGSTDNCTTIPNLIRTVSPSSFTTADIGAVQVTLTVKDEANLTNACVANSTVINNAIFDASDISLPVGGMGTVPITVSNFQNVTSFAFNVHVVDTTVATVNNLSNINPALAANGTFLTSANLNGYSVIWTATSAMVPITLVDSTILFEVDVTAIGNAVDTSIVDINSNAVRKMIGGVTTPDASTALDGSIALFIPITAHSFDVMINTEEGVPVANAMVKQTGGITSSIATNNSGMASFIANSGTTTTFNISKNTEWKNGVTVNDAFLVLQHPNPASTFGSGYKNIAADANADNMITGNDAIFIFQLAVDPATDSIPGNTSWRFIHDTPDLSTTANPWGLFSESYSTTVSADETVKFIGIKTGDVDADADALLRQNGIFEFLVENQSIKATEERVEVEFKAKDFKEINGYQYTIDFKTDLLEYINVIPGVLPNLSSSNFKDAKVKDGQLTTGYINLDAVDLNDNDVLFTLVFESKAASFELKDAISVSDNLIPMQVIKSTGELKNNVELVFESSTSLTEELFKNNLELRPNVPNPFDDETIIGFTLPGATNIQLNFMDATGKLLYKIDGDYSKGYHEVTVGKEVLPTTRVVFYQLKTKYGTKVRKMIIF